jgi:hypothetical protein
MRLGTFSVETQWTLALASSLVELIYDFNFSMATATSKVEIWMAFYDSNRDQIPTPPPKQLMRWCSPNYNKITQDLDQLGDELVVRMATLALNFIILPGFTVQGKILLLIHHCFAVCPRQENIIPS